MKKSTRTISGVTPVAVMTRPWECPGECIYCPTFPATPQSYTPESPAVLRGNNCDYNARAQIGMRLKAFGKMGHPTNKVELIVMGGTFLSTPPEYQYSFIKDCYDALNGEASATLEEAQGRNETALHRIVGLCIETRPDVCGTEEIAHMLRFGTTRVEMGVQMLDDDIYRLTGRGHTIADVVASTALLRRHGFKVHYHWMPGLPGSTPHNDLNLSRLLFDDPRFRPDGLKLYPTMVVEGTELESWQRQGRYQPYDDDVMTELIADIKALVPEYVRISRVLRDIPPQFIAGGLKNSIRDAVRQLMEERGTECRCIRCREYGHRLRQGREIGQPHLYRMDYRAAEGKEVFLSFKDDRETLFGLIRLRIQDKLANVPGQAEGVEALIRELHVYGPELALKERGNPAAQHKGLGKRLFREAERIAAADFGARRMAVLSGVGARRYYRDEFGYRLEGGYMVKEL